MRITWKWNTMLTVMMLFAAFIFYNPLPDNFTDNKFDRTIARFIEIFTRISYVYPTTYLCGDVYCELRWTRWVIDSSLWLVNLFSFDNGQLNVETVYFESIRARIYRPINNNGNIQLPAVLFIHGGGYVMGNIEGFEAIAKRFAKDAHAVFISVDYRLAPEHVFPAAVDDAENAVIYLLSKAYSSFGIDRSRIALMGDSAGGGLVAAVTQRLRRRTDLTPLKAQLLLYPLLQMSNLRTPSYEYYRRELSGHGFLEPRMIALYYLMYAGIDLSQQSHLIDITLNNAHLSPLDRTALDEFVDFDRLPMNFKYTNYNSSTFSYNEEASNLIVPFVLNPDFAPLMQPNLSSLPRALVVTCEHDVLRDEGIIYAQRLIEAGVPTTWKHFDTGFHALLNFHSTMFTASRALDYVVEWFKANV